MHCSGLREGPLTQPRNRTMTQDSFPICEVSKEAARVGFGHQGLPQSQASNKYPIQYADTSAHAGLLEGLHGYQLEDSYFCPAGTLNIVSQVAIQYDVDPLKEWSQWHASRYKLLLGTSFKTMFCG